MIRDDLVDCIVALPGQLFYTTGIPVCLWFLDRNKAGDGERDRKREVLFIDARQMGQKISRTQIELTSSDIERIVGPPTRWRGTREGDHIDEPGFSKSAALTEIEAAGFALSPGRYVGAAESEDDDVEFEERMAGLSTNSARSSPTTSAWQCRSRMRFSDWDMDSDRRNNWPIVQLGEVAEITVGFAFKSDGFSADPADVRLLRGDNIGQGRLRWDGAKRWPHGRASDFQKYDLASGDTVLAMDRPWIEAGLKYAIVRPEDLPSLLVQRVARLRGTPMLTGSFLPYVIGSPTFTNYVNAIQTGTAVPHISGSQIAAFELPLPSNSEQTRIASVLGALDDKRPATVGWPHCWRRPLRSCFAPGSLILWSRGASGQ